MRTLILGMILLGVCFADNRSNLQLAIDGVYKANQLQTTQEPLKCFNSTQVDQLFSYLTTYFDQASRATEDDLISLQKLTFNYIINIPATTGTCLTSVADFNQLQAAYETDIQYGLNKLVFYYKYNWAEATGVFGQLNNLWKQQKYEEAGNVLATWFHQILP